MFVSACGYVHVNAGHGARGIRSPGGGAIEACEVPEVGAGNQTHRKNSKCS